MKSGPFNRKPAKAARQKSMGISLFRPASEPALRPATNDLPPLHSPFAGQLLERAVDPGRVWDSLATVTLDTVQLNGNGLFPDATGSPWTVAFDMLRTRLLQGMAEYGWRRIAVTSPTHGCGKSLVAANLAFSMARRSRGRTVLLDLELRSPGLSRLLGAIPSGPLAAFLGGEQAVEDHFLRAGRGLALGLNDRPIRASAETLQDTETSLALAAMMERLDPDIAIYDLPPALAGDDVLSILPQVDAVLLVADGTRSTAEDIRACLRLLGNRVPLAGTVLNRAQDRDGDRYRYAGAVV